MPNNHLPSSLWTQEPLLTPENKVWRGVLEQAYADSELPLFSDGSEPMEKILGRSFLRADNAEEKEDLELVCGFAEVSADRVISWARQRYPAEHPLATHAECGSGAAAFLAAEASVRSQKREPCSRTPQTAPSRQAAAPA
jgi:hypothetical protein